MAHRTLFPTLGTESAGYIEARESSDPAGGGTRSERRENWCVSSAGASADGAWLLLPVFLGRTLELKERNNYVFHPGEPLT